MTTLDTLGCVTSVRSDDQSNVSIETMTMMATSAATGTCDTQGFSTHHQDQQESAGEQASRGGRGRRISRC